MFIIACVFILDCVIIFVLILATYNAILECPEDVYVHGLKRLTKVELPEPVSVSGNRNPPVISNKSKIPITKLDVMIVRWLCCHELSLRGSFVIQSSQ